MAIIDFPDESPDVGTSLRLVSNSTEFVSELNNATQDARMIGDQWGATMPFSNRPKLIGRKMKAFLAKLGGKSGRFRMTPPDLDQLGTMQGGGVVDGAGQAGTTLNTKGWLAGQSSLFEIGDYIAFNGELKIIVDMAQVLGDYIEYSGTNYMPSPFDPEGWYHIGDTDGTITNVALENPSGESFVGLVEVTGNYIIQRTENSGKQVGAVGDKFYGDIMYAPVNVQQGDRLTFVLFSTGGESENIILDAITFIPVNPLDSGKVKVTELSGGFYELEFYGDALYDATDYGVQFVLSPLVTGSGASCYVQASFFGKNPLEYPYALYNEFVGVAELGEWDYTRANGAVSNGLLNFTDDTGQASGYMRRRSSQGLAPFSGAKYSKIKTRWRPNIFGGPNPDGFFRWLTVEGGNYVGAYARTFGPSNESPECTTVGPDHDGFYTTLIDLAAYPEWSDEAVSGVRFDWDQETDSGPTDYDIDYIKIYSPSLLQAYEEYWPASYLEKQALEIAPPIRKATNDLDAIETTNPQAIFKLTSDQQADWDLQANYIYSASINCIEDVT